MTDISRAVYWGSRHPNLAPELRKRNGLRGGVTGCVIIAAALGFLGANGAQAACNSGPDFCTDDPRIPAALLEKKDRLAKTYPSHLVALLDRGVQCVARIRTSPDGFSVIDIEPNKDSISQPWAEDVEEISKRRLAEGEITHYWLVHTRRAFSCDGELNYDERADYIASEDINADLAIKCDSIGC